jgi:hypothetical protein
MKKFGRNSNIDISYEKGFNEIIKNNITFQNFLKNDENKRTLNNFIANHGIYFILIMKKNLDLVHLYQIYL